MRRTKHMITLMFVAVGLALLIRGTLIMSEPVMYHAVEPIPAPVATRIVYVPREIPDFPQLARPLAEPVPTVDAGEPKAFIPLPDSPKLTGVTWNASHPWLSLVTIEFSHISDGVLFSLSDDCSNPCNRVSDDWELTAVGVNFVHVLHTPSRQTQRLQLGAVVETPRVAPVIIPKPADTWRWKGWEAP